MRSLVQRNAQLIKDLATAQGYAPGYADEADTIPIVITASYTPPAQVARIVDDADAPLGYIYIMSEVRQDGVEVLQETRIPQADGGIEVVKP